MATKYFKNFPLVEYGGKSMRNVLLSVRLIKDVLKDYSQFYEYTIAEGERPTTVAYDYYGSVDFAWLVLLSNEIVDPYFEWPLTQQELDEMVMRKYGSKESAQNTIVAYQIVGTNAEVSPTTFQYVYADGEGANPNFTPIYAYDKEVALNEQRRNIKLIDNEFAPNIAIELEKTFR